MFDKTSWDVSELSFFFIIIWEKANILSSVIWTQSKQFFCYWVSEPAKPVEEKKMTW